MRTDNIFKTFRSLCDVLESCRILSYVKTDSKTKSGVFFQAVYSAQTEVRIKRLSITTFGDIVQYNGTVRCFY